MSQILIIFSPRTRVYLLRMRFRLVRRDAVETIVRRSKVGDWFLLYMLGENLDTVIYRDVMHDLANKLASRHQHGVPGVKGELQEAWSRWASSLVLFRARVRVGVRWITCSLWHWHSETYWIPKRRISSARIADRLRDICAPDIRARIVDTLNGFTSIKLISNRNVVTWYTRDTRHVCIFGLAKKC